MMSIEALVFTLNVLAMITPISFYIIYFLSIGQPKAIAKAVISASVAIAPVVLGSVKVTSAVEAGPISVALLVPLSESSKIL